MPDGWNAPWDVVSVERISPSDATAAPAKRPRKPAADKSRAGLQDGNKGGDTLRLSLTMPPGMTKAITELAGEHAELRTMVTARLDQMEKTMREALAAMAAAITAPRTVEFQRGDDGMIQSATSSTAKAKA